MADRVALAQFPLTFFDVETTGLTKEDRVVSLGLIQVDDHLALSKGGDFEARISYLIFNPHRPSHPIARKVHGYPDELLALQDPFEEHAHELEAAFRPDRLAVAHNASFDKRFISKEFQASRRPLSREEYYCTMLEHRRQYGPPSGLDHVSRQYGYAARKGTHGALNDAWRALGAFCLLNGYPIPAASQAPDGEPTNLRTTRSPAPQLAAILATTLAPTPIADPAALDIAVELVSPLATMLLSIARADGDLHFAEVETLSLLIHTMLSGSQVKWTDDEEQELLERLFAIGTGDAEIAAAATIIVANRAMRESLGGWVRQTTFADGSASTEEHEAIIRITDALRKANQRA